MHTGATFPSEVLERIAEKLGEISADFLLDESAWSEHYASLRSLCLVARCFRVIAQTLLAESLYIQDETTTKLWLESTATSRHDTKTLVINGSTGLDLSDSLWESILSKARSVETISTFYILRPRSKRSLAHPALSRLKRLQLGFSVTPDRSVVFFPFRLRKLSLSLFHSFPHDVVSSLLISSASTLVKLSIPVCEGTNHYPVVTRLYPIVSGRIERLSVIHDDPAGRFSQLLGNCTMLRRLDWDGNWAQLPSFLAFIPRPLETLSAIIRMDDDDALRILVESLELVALSRLRRIKLYLEGLVWEDVAVRVAFEGRCRERGIELILVE